jgi:hypothetical protein
MDAALRLGAQPNRFRAHAWVEHRGTPVFESDRMNGYLAFDAVAT